ncbi:MAG: hypothetical protein JWO86_4917 [Myxococcaceae bacterium]|nr:hypothetical protein [Myxococcaceae bacterium]MEA2746626.1 hypothetical protein [Myxococcales bacterium]
MAKAKARAKRNAKARSAPKAKRSAKAHAKAKTHAKAKSHAKAKARPAAPRSLVGVATHAERFERQAYDVPVLDLAEAVALATALLAVKPAKATAIIVEEAKRVAAARDRARSVQKTNGAHGATTDARAYDVAMDRAWATFVRRIQDHVELPGPRDASTADALRIFSIVSDLSILKLNFLAEFAQIGARLDALKREGLLDVAGRLTGPVFLEEVLRCHGEYGQALGLMPAGPQGDAVIDRGEARNALAEAIAEYAVQVMAQARAGRHDSWAPVQKALKPIMDLRLRRAREQHAHPAPAPRPVHPPIVRVEQPS